MSRKFFYYQKPNGMARDESARPVPVCLSKKDARMLAYALLDYRKTDSTKKEQLKQGRFNPRKFTAYENKKAERLCKSAEAAFNSANKAYVLGFGGQLDIKSPIYHKSMGFFGFHKNETARKAAEEFKNNVQWANFGAIVRGAFSLFAGFWAGIGPVVFSVSEHTINPVAIGVAAAGLAASGVYRAIRGNTLARKLAMELQKEAMDMIGKLPDDLPVWNIIVQPRKLVASCN
jgi:hypothetical protein